jgi:hypothetical protein
MRSRISTYFGAEFLQPYSSVSRLEPEDQLSSLSGPDELGASCLMPLIQLSNRQLRHRAADRIRFPGGL